MCNLMYKHDTIKANFFFSELISNFKKIMLQEKYPEKFLLQFMLH